MFTNFVRLNIVMNWELFSLSSSFFDLLCCFGELGVMPAHLCCVIECLCVFVCVYCFCPEFKGIPPAVSWHLLQQHAQQSQKMHIFTLHARRLKSTHIHKHTPTQSHTHIGNNCFACIIKQEWSLHVMLLDWSGTWLRAYFSLHFKWREETLLQLPAH